MPPQNRPKFDLEKEQRDDRVELVAGTLQSLAKMVPLLRWFFGGAAAIGMRVGLIQWRQSNLGEQFAAISRELVEQRKQMQQWEIWRAETTASRYTMQDHNRYAKLDKRAQRVEDAVIRISDSQARIEKSLHIAAP